MNRLAQKPAIPSGRLSPSRCDVAFGKVAEDLGVKKWWKPTPEMEKYVKTYLT